MNEKIRVAGQYSDIPNSIGIVTQLVKCSGYETFIKHPKLDKGLLKSVEKYGMSFDEAKKRHDIWVHRFKHPSKVTGYVNTCGYGVPYDMLCQRITFHALISLLNRFSDNESLLINTCAFGENEELAIYRDDGKFSGSCLYDISLNEVYCMTHNWQRIIDTTRKLIE